MNGARLVHDQLQLAGWQVQIADAQKVKGLAPLACKTDRIHARGAGRAVPPRPGPRDLAPTPGVRAERERARFRLHLVRHRIALKNRVHATLLALGRPCPMADLFGAGGRALLQRLGLPEPWAGTLQASLALIDQLDAQVSDCQRELRRLGADHPDVPLLVTAPGIAWVLGYTIAAEIGDITRFASPKKLCGYTGLCPSVYQSGSRDQRGRLANNGPKYLRWALIQATTHAARHPCYRDRYQATKQRLGRQRGPKVARVEVTRKLAEAIWHMLTRNQPFAPARPRQGAGRLTTQV